MAQDKIRTSRGKIAEAEEVVSNLLGSVEHLLDIPSDEEPTMDISIINDIRLLRNSILKTYAKDVDINYHCAYKHLLLARMQLRELIQSYGDQSSGLWRTFQNLEKILHYVRLKYFKVDSDKLEDPDCPRCLEDYLLDQKKESLPVFDGRAYRTLKDLKFKIFGLEGQVVNFKKGEVVVYDRQLKQIKLWRDKTCIVPEGEDKYLEYIVPSEDKAKDSHSGIMTKWEATERFTFGTVNFEKGGTFYLSDKGAIVERNGISTGDPFTYLGKIMQITADTDEYKLARDIHCSWKSGGGNIFRKGDVVVYDKVWNCIVTEHDLYYMLQGDKKYLKIIE